MAIAVSSVAVSSVSLAWFRRDLRLMDNPAWATATASKQVVPIVVIQPALLNAAGPWRKQAYLQALAGLEQSLATVGGGLWVEVGNPTEVLRQIVHEVDAQQVTTNADVTRWSTNRDQQVAAALTVPLTAHWGTMVHPPGRVLTAQGTLSRVFTPFYKTWAQIPLPDETQPTPTEVLTPPKERTLAHVLGCLGSDVPAPWSEQDALGQLNGWQQEVDNYQENRNLPAIAGTSELSTALRFGLLSPRYVMAQIGTRTPGRSGFVRQLAWRDWYAHLTAEHPNIAEVALRPSYDQIAWRSGASADADFVAWRDGQTGYPIVDAGMRQLAATGWMHNRVRMITASFLVKDLLVDWRQGERWFRHMLTDGEIAQNAGNWQWVAGTGPDAAPYVRIFNPITQSKRFDPQGEYLRRWLPELAQLNNSDIHAPWQASPLDLAASNVTLGHTYPMPIVDHAQARQRTITAYKTALNT